MKIAIISRGDASHGGSGRVAEQLARHLPSNGFDVTHFVRHRPRIDYQGRCERIPGVRGDVLLRNAIGMDISGLQIPFHGGIWEADLVHFVDHVVAYGAMAAYVVASRKPTVFRLPDYSGITGGCLYPKGCERFEQGCGECPQVGSWPLLLPVDLTRAHFELHRRIANTPQTEAVVPSSSHAHAARRGAWRDGSVQVVPNAVDSDVFHPRLRRAGRAELALSDEQRCLLFVAVNVLDERKGIEDLVDVFRRLRREESDLKLAVVGDIGRIPGRWDDITSDMIMLGAIEEDERLASIYAAADCYVVPSHADTFNITLIESMSAGTPVVAYPTGGMTEVFEHGRGGWFAEAARQDALEASLREILPRLPDPELSSQARSYAVSRYSIERMAESHAEIYRRVVESAS